MEELVDGLGNEFIFWRDRRLVPVSESNLSNPLWEFVRLISPNRVVRVAGSFHPTEIGARQHPMNPEIFVGRSLFLQSRGFRGTVNCVA